MPYHPRIMAALLALALTLAGCTGETPPPPTASSSAVNAPALPPDQFPPLPDRADAAEITVHDLASDGTTLVMVADVDGRRTLPLLRWSADAGATWTDWQLTDDAARATTVDEAASGVAAVAISGERRTWLALGTAGDDVIAWTSADAKTWNRTPVSGLDSDADHVESVSGLTGGGFVAVGQSWTVGVTKPSIWLSADGVGWTRAKAPAAEGYLQQVAARGDRLVAVGGHDLAERRNGRSGESLLFTSRDRGENWRAVTVPEPADSGKFYSSLGAVTATPSGFVVGGSYFDQSEGTYRPLLLRSTRLAAWRALPKLDEPYQSSGVGSLMSLGSTLIAAQYASTADDVGKAWVQRLEAGRWTTVSHPVAEASTSLWTASVANDTAVLAVQTETRPSSSALWRLGATGAITEVRVTPPESAGKAISPSGLMLVDGRVAGYGTAQGAEVWWPGNDQGGFDTPRVVVDRADDSIDHLAWSARGGFLATGSHADEHALTLHSADGTNWTRSRSDAFNATGQYHSGEINDLTWAHDQWVVVGEKSTNGDVRTSALAYTSTNGVRWTEGSPTKVTARGDWYDRNAPLDDLHGLENRGRIMNGVLAMPMGLVAVGETRSARYQRPAAWVSGNNDYWRLIRLDSPGYPAAALWSVVRVGDALVASGWARAAKAKRSVRAMWRSTDGGRSWTFHAFEGGEEGSLLAASENEFIWVVRSVDRHTLTLYRSPDGRTWTGQPLAVDGWADGVVVGLEDALVDGTQLHLMLTLANRLTASTVAQTVPL